MVQISKELFDSIVNYLLRRPYGEVAPLVNKLTEVLIAYEQSQKQEVTSVVQKPEELQKQEDPKLAKKKNAKPELKSV